MAKIEQYIIDKILETARIEDVVGDFVKLKRKGVRYVGCCPFHDDRHAGSFVVYPKKQCFKCFVCGAKGGAVEFLKKHEGLSFPGAIRWLGKKYTIETDMQDFKYTPPKLRPTPQPLELLVLPMSMVNAREDLTGNRLVEWIRNGVNWDDIQRSRINDVLNAYRVGQAKNGMTIFWQIDEKHCVHTGKMMLYKSDGHRDKTSKYNFDFIHSTLIRHRDPITGAYTDEPPYPYPHLFDPDKQEMKICYFGLHLLDAYKRKEVEQTVCIVESEKTALLMAIAYGNNAKQVWMACGGLENLNRRLLKPIIDQGRRIKLYPDRDAIDKWRAKAESLNYNNVFIDEKPVTLWWKECDGQKADIADVVVRIINEHKPIKTIEQIKQAMPNAAGLINKLNLTIESNDRRTNTD